MGLRRWLTVMTCITAGGAVLARPDDVSHLVRSMTTFVGSLHAEQTVAQTTSGAGASQPVAGSVGSASEVSPAPAGVPQGAALPGYVPGGHTLTFKSDGKSDDSASDGEAADGSAVAHPQLQATAAVPEAVKPPSPPAGAAISPVVVDNSAASTSSDSPIRSAAITIEPDPSLKPATPATMPAYPAKKLFGQATAPAPLAARAIGTYARGCLAGGVALPVDGPAWQAMRLSRNRNWGHPKLVKLVEKLALDSQTLDKWPGLLVGDISQPRGGPMLTGHASHQVGLDADIWLTPMPNRRLSRKEREDISATSMLDATDIAVDPKVFTPGHVQLIKRAASYPDVERVLVHPAIKKALCEAAGSDRGWLGKVRPIQGHYYHFHVRIGCPAGSTTCTPQKPPSGDDGCGKEVQEWIARVTPPKGPPPPKPPGWKPPPPAPPISLAQLPRECVAVLESGPDAVPIPAEARLDLKAIANAPAALRPHLRKAHAAKN